MLQIDRRSNMYHHVDCRLKLVCGGIIESKVPYADVAIENFNPSVIAKLSSSFGG